MNTDKSCGNCAYATKIGTRTYRCRKEKYDILTKSCFEPKDECQQPNGQTESTDMHQGADA